MNSVKCQSSVNRWTVTNVNGRESENGIYNQNTKKLCGKAHYEPMEKLYS